MHQTIAIAEHHLNRDNSSQFEVGEVVKGNIQNLFDIIKRSGCEAFSHQKIQPAKKPIIPACSFWG
jgi:hypothetical protein